MAESYDPVARLNELIQDIPFAMFTTVRPDSTLHSCPMATQPADGSGVLWFLSGSNTEKVEAVRTVQRVNLAYSDAVSQRYVSVSGFCELVRDHLRSKAMWNPQYSAWFPGGVDDPNLILLKVNVQQVEYWDKAQGRMVELLGFARPAID
ncbi:MAG TPA: pyridoxamine 5'-phosphate oxidase family protein [Candidatus Binatia bacterium]|nr:pyridoxamine 5'-phosphate oxidase family protein [Candidatus Binatia bacterium]